MTRVRFPGEIIYKPTSDPLVLNYTLSSEFTDLFKNQRYPLSLLQLHLFGKELHIYISNLLFSDVSGIINIFPSSSKIKG